MTYIKKIMEIGSGTNSIATEDVFGISGEFDMDNSCGSMGFSLPYYIPLPDSSEPQYLSGSGNAGLNTRDLKKFDTVKLYFGEYQTDPGEIIQQGAGSYSAGGVQLKTIFDGFIDEIRLNKTKDAITYEFKALGTLGLANYRNLAYEHLEGTAYDLFQTWLQISGLQIGPFNVYPVDRNLIPVSQIRFIDVDAQNWVLISDGGTTLKEVIDGIRNKYALIVHQSGDGYINIMTPVFLLQARNNATLSVNAWAFDLNEGNLYEIDYGDLTTYYNAVVVLGIPPVYGVAVDPVGVANNGGQVSYLIFENSNLASDEECQRVARNKLLDLEKNYFISFKTKFHPEFMIGQPFTIKDNDRFTGAELLVIKKYTFTINKDDVSCVVQGFSHVATLIPEDVALSDTGVLDVDVLQIRDKELSPEDWKQIGGDPGGGG